MTRSSTNKSQFVGRYLNVWLRHYDTPELGHQAEKLPIRQDMITLLTYVRDNKVVGTKSTGNMPLKAVREVTACFVDPPQLDKTIWERTYRLRSETEIWPLYFLHILADVGGLLKIAQARRWQLMPNGKKFLDNFPLLQVVYLFTIWWNEVNWLVAYPVQGMGDDLPSFFNVLTLGHLLETCAVGKSIPFEKFADELIEKTGLVWATEDSSYARMFLHSSIKRMVIDVLKTFDGAKCKYREKSFGSGIILELDTFELTQFGRALLDTVAVTIS